MNLGSTGRFKEKSLWLLTVFAFCLGVGGTWGLWAYIHQQELRAEKETFISHAKVFSEEIEFHLELALQGLVSLKAFFDSSETVSLDEFKEYTRSLLNFSSEIKALEWVPVVSRENLQSFEKKVAQLGFEDFRVKEKDFDGSFVRVGSRPFYYPVTFIEPYIENKRAHGFDLGSDFFRRKSMLLSQKTEKFSVSKKINLIQYKGRGSEGFLVFLPVFEKRKRRKIKGFIVGAYQLDAIINNAARSSAGRVAVSLFDVTGLNAEANAPAMFNSGLGQKSERKFYRSMRQTLPLYHEETLRVGNRTWKAVFFPSFSYASSSIRGSVFVLVFGGLVTLLVSLLTVFFVRSSERAIRLSRLNQDFESLNRTLERRISSRTRQLEKSNSDLSREVKSSHLQKKIAFSLIEDAQRAQKELQEAELKLQQKNLDLEQFVYVASHDLQAPLRHVTAYIEILREELSQFKLSSDAKDALDTVHASAKRMRSLIQGLLSYARVGNSEIERSEVDLNEVVQNVTEILKSDPNYVPESIQTSRLPVVYGDSVQLELLLLNLIQNGLKYHIEGQDPKVELTWKEGESADTIFIKDNGIGIPSDQRSRIFKIFNRLHDKNQYSGTGIGLAICKKIVERHGGEIGIESSPSQGSIFYFSIPKKQSSE